MSKFRGFLLSVTVIAVASSAVGLGRWQLRRLGSRRRNNAVLLAARELPPLELPGQPSSRTPIDSGRRIVAHGRYDPDGQITLRGRVQNDGPGLQVVTPFVLDSSAGVLWVVRGFVASADAVTPPDTIPPPPPGSVTVAGLALGIPVTRDSGAPLRHNGSITWQRLDRETLYRLKPGSLPVYLLLAADPAGPAGLALVPPPEFSDGPHLSYAIQWFGIASAVLTFGVIVFWRAGHASTQPPAAP